MSCLKKKFPDTEVRDIGALSGDGELFVKPTFLRLGASPETWLPSGKTLSPRRKRQKRLKKGGGRKKEGGER